MEWKGKENVKITYFKFEVQTFTYIHVLVRGNYVIRESEAMSQNYQTWHDWNIITNEMRTRYKQLRGRVYVSY